VASQIKQKPRPLPFDPATVDAISRAQKAVGDDYTAGLINALGNHLESVPWQATPFQEEAASKASRLYQQNTLTETFWPRSSSDPNFDPKTRSPDMVGSIVFGPATGWNPTPLRKIERAREISDAASLRRVTADQKKRGR